MDAVLGHDRLPLLNKINFSQSKEGRGCSGRPAILGLALMNKCLITSLYAKKIRRGRGRAPGFGQKKISRRRIVNAKVLA
jgi:hypothetical protein